MNSDNLYRKFIGYLKGLFQEKNIFIPLTLIFFIMAVVISFFELLKGLIYHEYIFGELSILTIFVTSLISTLFAYIALQSYRELYQKTCEEITRRQKSEKVLSEREKLYRKLVEFTSDFVTIVISGKIFYVNPTGAKLLGFSSKEDLIGRKFTSLVHNSYKDSVKERLKKVFEEDKEIESAEEVLICSDGTEVYISNAMFPFNFQGKKGVLIIGRDLMDKKKSDEALQQSEERFKSMVQNIHEYIYSTSYKDGKVISSYHSPKCLSITGFTSQEYQDDPDLWINMVVDEDRECVMSFFNNFKKENSQKTIEHRINHKDGYIKWLSNTFSIITDEAGEIIRIDGFILDITDRKMAERALKEQFHFLQKLIDTIPNPIFYKNIEGTYQGCNIAFEKLLGISRKDIVGKKINEIMHADKAAVYHKIDRELFSRPGIKIHDVNLRTTDGQIHNFIINKADFYDVNGSLAGLVGVFVDITRLHDVQEELRKTLGRLKEMESIINKSPVIVFRWFAEDNWPVEFVSENINQFGYKAEQFLQDKLKFADIIHPQDREHIKEELEVYSKEGYKEIIQEYRLISKDSATFWIDSHIWIHQDEVGKVTYYQGIIIDKTKRKRAEQLLKESRERYKTLAENSYDLIAEIGSDLRFLYVSPSYTEVLGYTQEEFISKSILEFIHIDDMANLLEELHKDYIRVLFRYKHKNGHWLWFESAGRRYLTATGKKRSVLVSRDISERKKFEEQLVQTEKLMAIGEMSAMVAHEFRNALTSVKMILQLQSESINLTDYEKKSIDVAVNSIYHMEDVVQQLLNYAHPTPMELQIGDLNTIVKECLPFALIQAKKKFVRIINKFDVSLPPILIHSASIKDAILNLLINAVQAFDSTNLKVLRRVLIITKRVMLQDTIKDYDFSYSGEHIKVKNKLNNAQEIVISKGTECALIEIKDNGCGIDSNSLNRIFEPFFTTKEKGSGLGLPIVKRTVNAHGGVITVDSKPRVGTIFKIYIPLEQKKFA